MNRVYVFLLVVVCTSVMPISGQESTGNASGTLFYEDGVIANGTYSNDCFGFSLPIPPGWEVDPYPPPLWSGKAQHSTDGKLVLSSISDYRVGSQPLNIILKAYDISGHTASARDFVSDAVHGNAGSQPPAGRKLLRDVFEVEYGGKHFYRADYQQTAANGPFQYYSLVYTLFRGYLIGETISSSAPEGLTDAADSLQKIAFQEDVPNPNCKVQGPGGGGVPVGVIGGIISSKLTVPPDNAAHPMRIRVSQAVATAMLVKMVQPRYPQEAQRQRVQGLVFLVAQIDTKGNVKDIKLLRGDPQLVAAAMEAVNQWKYNPFLLEGHPVEVETQIAVSFQFKTK